MCWGRADKFCPILYLPIVGNTRHCAECYGGKVIHVAVGIGYNRPGFHGYLRKIGYVISWQEENSLLVRGRIYGPS